ncbi:MAG: quinone-dependent dihydroorotate dehydrogenase [Rhodothermales bacterium]|nr:quinone-dependent dihydroorotate dehydrogenase [Rhodothermales bacterium]
MYESIRPVLFRLGAEAAHHAAVLGARIGQTVVPGVIESRFSYAHPALHQMVFGRAFTNPIGIAAGFDKNATMIPFWKRAGCGFVEVGSVTAKKSKGNPRPRAFRLPDDRALVNRMGLNNDGVEKIAPRVSKHTRDPAFTVGVNIAKTHDPSIEGEAAVEDFCATFRRVAPLAHYVALNISCPNTREGKTFEDPNVLDDLLRAVMAERREHAPRVPILVKFSPPDETEFVFDSLYEELLLVTTAHGVDGYIASNTAADRDGLQTSPERLNEIGAGGLSGRPVAERSTALVRYIYRKTEGECPIIGVGGIDSPEAAYAKIKAGASLLQVYTGLVYEGPGLIRTLKKGIVELMAEEGHSSIGAAVGIEA